MELKGCEPYWLIHLFDANNAPYVEHRIKGTTKNSRRTEERNR